MMPLQRIRDAESRVRNKLSNGPLRVQSNAQGAYLSWKFIGKTASVRKVFCNVRHTLAAGDIYVSYRVHGITYVMNQGGTAKK